MPSFSSAHIGASSVSRTVSEPAPKRSSSQSATERDDPPGGGAGIDRRNRDGGRGRLGRAFLQRGEGGRSRQHRAAKGEDVDQAGGCQGPSCALHSPSHRDQSARGMSSVGVVMDV